MQSKETQMEAIVWTQYGPPEVLQFKEVAKPAPKDNEVLVKVHAASVNTVDLAGRVEAVGSSVTQFQPGDEVFGRGLGAFAEYACAREDTLVLKPANSSFEEAAAAPVAALTALQGLRDKGKIQPGQ